jgi:hypothetical protein
VNLGDPGTKNGWNVMRFWFRFQELRSICRQFDNEDFNRSMENGLMAL